RRALHPPRKTEALQPARQTELRPRPGYRSRRPGAVVRLRLDRFGANSGARSGKESRLPLWLHRSVRGRPYLPTHGERLFPPRRWAAGARGHRLLHPLPTPALERLHLLPRGPSEWLRNRAGRRALGARRALELSLPPPPRPRVAAHHARRRSSLRLGARRPLRRRIATRRLPQAHRTPRRHERAWFEQLQ